MSVRDILEEIRALSPEERRRLMKLMVDLLEQPSNMTPKKRSLRELRGLGKEIWTGIDAQEYVDQQRDEWNARS